MSKKVLTFASIGVLNTATDVGLFVVLYDHVGLPLLLSNIISTSVALCVSFVLNARYTFTDNGPMTRNKFARFLGVTLTGLWVLQPLIIAFGLYLLHHVGLFHEIIGAFVNDPARFDAGLAKLGSVPFTLLWNYLLYEKLVFKSKNS